METHPNGMATFESLTSSSSAELVEAADKQLAHERTSERHIAIANVYIDELRRRNQDQATRAMLKLTRDLRVWAVIVCVATFASVGIALLSFLHKRGTIP